MILTILLHFPRTIVVKSECDRGGGFFFKKVFFFLFCVLRFYVCYDGKLKQFRCADGIHWNQAERRCDFPENANCTVSIDSCVYDILTFKKQNRFIDSA